MPSHAPARGSASGRTRINRKDTHAISSYHAAGSRSRCRARFLLQQARTCGAATNAERKGRYTNVFLAAPQDESLVKGSKGNGREAPLVEITYNWDSEDYGEARYFGHLAFEVNDIYATCDRLMKAGVTINRPPRDGDGVRALARQTVD